jgi:hypothetical protein
MAIMPPMIAPADAPGPTKADPEEFSAFLARYHIDLVLQKRHFMRLGIGMVASLVVLSYNVFHPHAAAEMRERSNTAEWIILIHLMLCLAIITVYGWRLRRELRRQAVTLREQAMRVVNFVHRWGNLLLFLAATGHGVLVLGTMLGLDVFSRDGWMLLISLAPTLLVIIHGVTQVPTVDRLCSIHRMTKS